MLHGTSIKNDKVINVGLHDKCTPNHLYQYVLYKPNPISLRKKKKLTYSSMIQS